jgi:chemotaxis protein histidine kinase CheA
MAVVILKEGKTKYGLIVDDTMMEEEPLVLYPLDQRLGSIRGVLGTAMTADGSPVPIVDIHALFDIIKNKAF